MALTRRRRGLQALMLYQRLPVWTRSAFIRTAPILAMSAGPATRDSAKIYINSAFDAGNIAVADASTPNNIQLQIRPDPFCQKDNRAHFQWFYFQVTGAGTMRSLTATARCRKRTAPHSLCHSMLGGVCSALLIRLQQRLTQRADLAGCVPKS